ncbi:argininosuccinate lyase [Deinococcus peraridilitoris]|uniref:Argininosuccinate lyase n=1 Tax=Deinococcus peraridilitoris (strain DSM 19664 / LMG 22246 / CIP 109416 / KR-200) TaxID=937777 RepID=L0A5U0_DEIPD|nr:argininosuccinate lyase [Deinococcus peraridilitoris]AFZ68385.1 argininosuccinate lyase [Deinococcus peraridilitoris DSM 19664]
MTTNTSDKKLWGGRFAEATDGLVERFNASVGFDQRLAEQDIRASLAHVAMLGQQGILEGAEVARITGGLQEILTAILAGNFEWRLDREDVHMNVEADLRDRIGGVAGKLHTARSRNDQVATDFRLFVREAAQNLAQLTRALRATFVAEAERHLDPPVLMPGYTHLQVAQPIALSHWFLAYAEMLERDEGRLLDAAERMNESPLGAGALAGTPWPIDREATARALGFARPMRNSLDAVASRDFALEFLSACAILIAHLSRLSEELILFSTFEFGFVTLPDSHTTGSSIMPQKKNPDVSELARGKAGRVFGALMGLLTVVKGTPLAYNKDLQEDKESVFDAYDTLSIVLRLYADMLPKAEWHATTMRQAASRGYSTATDLADFLAMGGLPFREAHEVVGGLVGLASRTGRQLWELSDEELRAVHPLLSAEVASRLTVEASVSSRQSFGGTAPDQVGKQIQAALERLKEHA